MDEIEVIETCFNQRFFDCMDMNRVRKANKRYNELMSKENLRRQFETAPEPVEFF